MPSCAEGGVLGVLPGIIGCIQANETIKLILGIGEPLIGRFLRIRRAADEVPRAEAAQGPGLPGLRHASDRHEADRLRAVLRRAASRRRAGATARQAGCRHSEQEITVLELKARRDRGEDLFVLDVREPHEYQINRIPARR